MSHSRPAGSSKTGEAKRAVHVVGQTATALGKREHFIGRVRSGPAIARRQAAGIAHAEALDLAHATVGLETAGAPASAQAATSASESLASVAGAMAKTALAVPAAAHTWS